MSSIIDHRPTTDELFDTIKICFADNVDKLDIGVRLTLSNYDKPPKHYPSNNYLSTSRMTTKDKDYHWIVVDVFIHDLTTEIFTYLTSNIQILDIDFWWVETSNVKMTRIDAITYLFDSLYGNQSINELEIMFYSRNNKETFDIEPFKDHIASMKLRRVKVIGGHFPRPPFTKWLKEHDKCIISRTKSAMKR